MKMFVFPFCKICEMNTEREIVFVLILKVRYNTSVISGSQMGSELLQNKETIKHFIKLIWKI